MQNKDLTEDEIKKIIREEIESKLPEIKAELDKIEFTDEDERIAREISKMTCEEWFRPFTI